MCQTHRYMRPTINHNGTKMAERDDEIERLHKEIDRLRDLYEPQIVDLRAVAPCGETMLTVGYDRNGRWVKVMVPTAS